MIRKYKKKSGKEVFLVRAAGSGRQHIFGHFKSKKNALAQARAIHLSASGIWRRGHKKPKARRSR
jgi:hypothetical protein